MILLDTSLIVWLMRGVDRIGPAAQAHIDTHHPVYYSSVSILELAIKAMSGKLTMPAGLVQILDDEGLRQMPLSGEHAEALDEFPELVGHDPFDRVLLAQAATEGLAFITADRRLLALDRPWIVDATT